MAGLGKYKKGAKFKLKSGNTPPFKYMASSPLKQEEKVEPKYTTTDQGEILERDPDQIGGAFEWFFTPYNTSTDSIVTNPDGTQEIVKKEKKKP